MKRAVLSGMLALAALVSCNKGGNDPRLVIITYDGLRWQEVYGGADEALVNDPKYTPDAAALKAKYGGETPEVREIANRIAAYMLREQPRTAEGAFRRRDDTVWADDMYMSVPFLCRYSAWTGDPAGLDTCADQLLKYRDLLCLPGIHIDFKREGIPVGEPGPVVPPVDAVIQNRQVSV